MSDKPNDMALLLNLLAQERGSEGLDHPTPERLTAYHAGELSPAECEEIQEHLALCRPCARLVLEIPTFYEEIEEAGESPTVTALGAGPRSSAVTSGSQPAVAGPAHAAARADLSWQAFRAGLSFPPVASGASRAKAHRGSRVPSPLVYALAASLALCLGIVLVLATRQRFGATLRLQPILVLLPGISSDISRGAEQPRRIDARLASRPLMFVIPVLPGPASARYRLELLSRSGELHVAHVASPVLLTSLSGLAPELRASSPAPSTMALSLSLAPRQLPAGEYRLRVSAVRSGRLEPLVEYRLQLLGSSSSLP